MAFMDNSERQIALVEGPYSYPNTFSMRGPDYPDTFNLFWMDKRLVAIHTGVLITRASLLSVIGAKIDKAIEPREKEENDLTLDEMLSRDEKSFTIFYSCIEQVRLLGPESRFALPELEIKSGKIQKMFFLTDAQFEQLSNILPSIPELSGKLIR
jgi:hypothetical protein